MPEHNNSLLQINDRFTAVESILRSICTRLDEQAVVKEWYTTAEVADLLGKRQYTVQQKWCNQGRVECKRMMLESGESQAMKLSDYWREED